MNLPTLQIGHLTARLPLIQGGMGVGISLSKLAGAVAEAGGVGILSTAQIGYNLPGFSEAPIETNLRAIAYHLDKAREIAGISIENGKRTGTGLIGVNIMVATKRYEDYCRAAAKAGADLIISGAGLPVSLPEYVEGTETKIAPIVSSAKAADLILKMWARKYHRTADLVVIEGPHAGGHLGFHKEELPSLLAPGSAAAYDKEIQNIIACVKEYGRQFHTVIPVVLAGGIFTAEDVAHAFSLGAQGVQVATPFVTTVECDASDAYKQAYLQAGAEDVELIVSPVGMPARAIHNEFLENIKKHREPVSRCFQCIEKCNPAATPYCITKALVNAVTGNLKEGLIFCGDNVAKLNRISTVREVIEQLFPPKADFPSPCTSMES